MVTRCPHGQDHPSDTACRVQLVQNLLFSGRSGKKNCFLNVDHVLFENTGILFFPEPPYCVHQVFSSNITLGLSIIPIHGSERSPAVMSTRSRVMQSFGYDRQVLLHRFVAILRRSRPPATSYKRAHSTFFPPKYILSPFPHCGISQWCHGFPIARLRYYPSL